jgi:hypothetical protein
MALIVGYGGSRYATLSASRGPQSGGSVGGNTKAGIFTGSPFMRVFNIGNAYTYRMPQRPSSLQQLFTMTTRNPLQYGRGSYAVTHSGTLLG